MTLALLAYHDLVDGEIKKYALSTINNVDSYIGQLFNDDHPYILVIRIITCGDRPSDDHPRFTLKAIKDTPGFFNMTFNHGKVIQKMKCDINAFMTFMYNHIE